MFFMYFLLHFLSFWNFYFIMEEKYQNYVLFCLSMALEIQLMLIYKVHSSFEAFIIYLYKKAKWIWGQH